MAQVIAPEVWQEGIDDNRLLPGRVTAGLFQGSLAPNAKIANNGGALRVWDMAITDYITDYDDRRLNGLAGTNTEGRDGWGASACTRCPVTALLHSVSSTSSSILAASASGATLPIPT